MRITVPCTMNGQIAAGEVNRYRFQANKGQRLVISVKARQLVPYVADGVPGWYQAVLKSTTPTARRWRTTTISVSIPTRCIYSRSPTTANIAHH